MPLMTYEELVAFTGPEDQLHQLIAWKSTTDYAAWRRYKVIPFVTEEHKMQRKITIEVCVDYADSEKNHEIRTTAQQCARRLFATCNLIADNPKATRIAIWSDDFYSGHEEIALLDDVLGEVTTETINESDAGEISADLMGALKDGV